MKIRRGMKKKYYYVVEMAIGNYWVNAWSNNNGDPLTFKKYEHAETELNDHLKSYQEAFDEGFVSDVPDPAQFRIVELYELVIAKKRKTANKTANKITSKTKTKSTTKRAA